MNERPWFQFHLGTLLLMSLLLAAFGCAQTFRHKQVWFGFFRNGPSLGPPYVNVERADTEHIGWPFTFYETVMIFAPRELIKIDGYSHQSSDYKQIYWRYEGTESFRRFGILTDYFVSNESLHTFAPENVIAKTNTIAKNELKARISAVRWDLKGCAFNAAAMLVVTLAAGLTYEYRIRHASHVQQSVTTSS